MVAQATLGDGHDVLVVEPRTWKQETISLAVERSLQPQVCAHAQSIGERRIDHPQFGVVTNRPCDEVNDTERLTVLRRRHQQHDRPPAGFEIFPERTQLGRERAREPHPLQRQPRIHHAAIMPEIINRRGQINLTVFLIGNRRRHVLMNYFCCLQHRLLHSPSSRQRTRAKHDLKPTSTVRAFTCAIVPMRPSAIFRPPDIFSARERPRGNQQHHWPLASFELFPELAQLESTSDAWKPHSFATSGAGFITHTVVPEIIVLPRAISIPPYSSSAVGDVMSS